MFEKINTSVDLLEKALRAQCRLVDKLIECSHAEERVLQNDELIELKEVAETQEELVFAFSEQDKVRVQQVKVLSELLAFDTQTVSLQDIIRELPDHQSAQRLEKLRYDLSEKINLIQEKNHTLHEILALKSEYVDTMLGILMSGPEVPGQVYDARGGLTSAFEDGGIYEVLI